MRTDLEIKQDVLEELIWQPLLEEKLLCIEVKYGVVRLSGTVNNLAEKKVVENAVKKVKGVKAIEENIEVEFKNSSNDIDLLKKINFDLEWNTSVPQEKINVKVKDRHVFLTGKVKWAYQKSEAEKSLEYIDGIISISNDIAIVSAAPPINIVDNITKAFQRSATIDANNIDVTVEGNTAILRGSVNSIKEKDDALKAAYLATGITDVKNELQVEYVAIYT
jgi:osmotically-inducible protein OsmY